MRRVRPQVRPRKPDTLAEWARTQAAGLVRPEVRFRFYINAIEALQLTASELAGGLDNRKIRDAKKRLLHDVQLEGAAPGLDDHPLDVS